MTQLRERMLEELERRNMRLLLPGLTSLRCGILPNTFIVLRTNLVRNISVRTSSTCCVIGSFHRRQLRNA